MEAYDPRRLKHVLWHDRLVQESIERIAVSRRLLEDTAPLLKAVRAPPAR